METTIRAQADAAQAGTVRWRRLDARLWVARRDGAPIGMVEEGHRFVATDAGDVLLGRFRTLADARAAVEAGVVPPPRRTRLAAAPWVVTGISLLVAGAGGAVLLLGL